MKNKQKTLKNKNASSEHLTWDELWEMCGEVVHVAWAGGNSGDYKVCVRTNKWDVREVYFLVESKLGRVHVDKSFGDSHRSFSQVGYDRFGLDPVQTSVHRIKGKIYELLEDMELGYGVDRKSEHSDGWSLLSQWLADKASKETGELKLSGEEAACLIQQVIVFEGLAISVGDLHKYEDFEEPIESGVCDVCKSGTEDASNMNEARYHTYRSLGVAEMFMFGPNGRRSRKKKGESNE